MVVFRIQKTKYRHDLSGMGSTLVPGRWNLAGGKPILYTSSSRSLAILEMLAHLTNGVKPPPLVMLNIYVPDNAITAVDVSKLPKRWDEKGYIPEVQQWGMRWLESNSSLALSVPSIISKDPNILINPTHSRFGEVKIGLTEDDFLIDNRLL